MIRKIILLWWVMVAGLGMGSLSAVAYGAELKIGYVNAIKVMEQAPQGEATVKKLQAEFGPRDKQLLGMQENIKKLEEELEKNALIMKETDRRDKERDLLVLKRDLRRASQEIREDYNMRRNEELAALQRMVKRVIVEIAKQENYDLILAEGTIYASNAVDITDKVLERLKKRAESK